MQRRRHFLAPGMPQYRQSPGSVPSPPSAEYRRLQHRLRKRFFDGSRFQVTENILHRHRQAGPQREIQPIVRSRRLQLKIERPADFLPQRHPPSPVDLRPKRSVNHQLHPAAFVKKTLGHHPLLGRRNPQYAPALFDISHKLPAGLGVNPRLGAHPSAGRIPPGLGESKRGQFPIQRMGIKGRRSRQQPVDPLPQLAHFLRQLAGAPGSLAQPERDGRRLPVGIFHPDAAAFHPADFPGIVAQQKHIPPHTFDREIFVDRPHESVFWLGDNVVIRVFRDRPAAGHRRQRSAAPPLDLAVHPVTMQVSRPPPLPPGKALGQRFNNLIKFPPGQFPVRISAAKQGIQIILAPFLLGARGHHLLRQHIHRPGRDGQSIQVAAADGAAQRHAFGQFIARQRKQPPLGRPPYPMPGTPHPLQQHPDGAGGTDLANQINIANVDAQLQRRRSHAYLNLPRFQPFLGIQPGGAGKAAVMRRHRLLPQPGAQLKGNPLHQLAGVDENQSSFMFLRQPGHRIQRLAPKLMRCDRPQFLLRQLQRQIQLPGMAGIHNGASRPPIRPDKLVAHQQPGDLLDRPLRRRQPNPHHRPLRQSAKPLHRQRQMRPPLVISHGMNFVKNKGIDPPQPLPPANRRKQNVQRFRRSDQNMRRLLSHSPPFRRAGIPRPNPNTNLRPPTPAIIAPPIHPELVEG